MDTSLQDGLSKVTVECSDPSGLFSEARALITRNLPLRNLHWKSPTRPVRSIESLNVELIPAKLVVDDQASHDATTSSVIHRRHQIPGLRQTPYLKIYLLRCDDNETYKTSSRKLLRDWIKTHAATPQSSSSAGSQENHDAFEWLIVHIVQNGEAPEKTSNQSMWPGRGATTVLEKVKADFNGSSKSAVDRVAQLRFPKPGSTQDHPELADQLDDLIEKMKNAILTSFDLRVRQYEEDIREKDSQRNLPGWNFCTFFILKEGLARGFENVGLLEDALVGYDELSVGLETVIREHVSGTNDQHGGTFLAYSKEWKQTAEAALEAISNRSLQTEDENYVESDLNGDGPHEISVKLAIEKDTYPLDLSKKPYRDMILANNISIFDFRSYLFSRQLTLLLRAAKAPSLNDEGNMTGQKSNREDLTVLAEICERASEFITIAARTLRYDLECGLGNSAVDANGNAKSEVINNIVYSWTYAASFQILSQSATPILVLPEPTLIPAARPELPKRSSSLLTPNGASGRIVNEVLSPDHQNPTAPRTQEVLRRTMATMVRRTGNDRLASGRGQLFRLARRTVEEIGRRRGWAETWKDFELLFNATSADIQDLKEISLDRDEPPTSRTSKPKQKGRSQPDGIDLPALKAVWGSRKMFHLLYEELTDQMLRHYVAADRTKSAEMAMADIGFLRFCQADYATAASYFHSISPFYANNHWATLEGSILELYARCLKNLKRKDEYIRVLLRLLASYAKYLQGHLFGKPKAMIVSSPLVDHSGVATYLEELFRASEAIQKEYSVPLADFFGEFEVNPAIRHYDDRDGFKLQLSLRSLLDRDIMIKSIKLRLVNSNGLQNNEVWLESSEEVVVKPILTRLLIGSFTTLQGKYFVDRIEIRAGNIVFFLGGGNHSVLPPGFRGTDEPEEENRPFIWCYAPVNGLEARIASPHHLNLDELRTLEVELDSGWNRIIRGVLRVRPATAGLRLRIAEMAVVDGVIDITANHDSGNIEFVNFGPNFSARLRIPYTVDENHTMLAARLEVGYDTEHGRFAYSSTNTIVSTLPVSVNVQDIFKDEVLFSRFTVSPAMLIPLRILSCRIPSSEYYDVESSIEGPITLDVFPKQPASILYKIRQRGQGGRKQPDSKPSLRLTVEFTCVDEECLTVVKNRFSAAIETSKFRQLSRLLTPHIVESFRTQLSTSDMETIGLVRKIRMLPYESVQWETVVGGLGQFLRSEIQTWLMKWHKCNPVITLTNPDPSVLRRRIVIPVDVPEVQVVHTAELRLDDLTAQAGGQTHAAVGHVIPAELRLHHTRRWCCKFAESEEPGGAALEFSYEVHASPELWLVGGRRRGNFTAQAGETRTFAITLLPQRAGHLLLPTIDVKTFLPTPASPQSMPTTTSAATNPVPTGGVGAGPPPPPPLPGSLNQRRQVPSELDYRNHSETLLVLPDLRKTTVTVEPGSPGGGSWLIDSEPRIKA